MALREYFKRKDTVIYTSIFGDYDDLKSPAKDLTSQCDFICFTDNRKLKSKEYKIIYCERSEIGNPKDSRKYKILPHLYLPIKYEYSIWIDASVQLRSFKVRDVIKKYLTDNDWAVFQHPERNCTYKEVDVCVDLKKDNKEVMVNQVNKYKSDGYPSENGLTANGFIIRRHNDPEVVKLSDAWWREIIGNSTRDQLSFPYIAWKNDFKYTVIDKNIWNNEYFNVLEHKK